MNKVKKLIVGSWKNMDYPVKFKILFPILKLSWLTLPVLEVHNCKLLIKIGRRIYEWQALQWADSGKLLTDVSRGRVMVLYSLPLGAKF